jgi:aspartate racemase
MKTIGLIGGLSWESSAEYYRLINETVKARLGGLHSAKCLMYSFDFAQIETWQQQGEWERATGAMVQAAQRLEAGGADFLVICSNTMHRMAIAIQEATSLPLLHIADATAAQIQHQNLRTIGLLGTRFTMEEAFYKQRLIEDYGLQVLVPDEPGRSLVHQVIYQELCQGVINPTSRQQYQQVIQSLVDQGATGIILGCTEIGLLVKPEDSPVLLFDTTKIHAIAAVDLALQGKL